MNEIIENDFQVAYRWRLNNNKYLYITDTLDSNGFGIVTGVYGGAPFIYSYNSGVYSVSYYNSSNKLVTNELDGETNVSERDIAVYSRTKFNNNETLYKTQFSKMQKLMSTDEHGAKLTLLSYENYYNVSSGDTCSVGYDKVDCDLYDLAFSGSVYKIPYGKDPVVDIAGPINIEQYKKTLKTYRMTFGVPQGPRGDRGTFDEMTPNYMENDGTTYFPIFRSNKHPYTTFNEEKNIGLGIKYNINSSGKSIYTFDVTKEIPNPEYGYYLTINENDDDTDVTRYDIKDIAISEDTGYVILTFDDDNTIPGGDGYWYSSLFLIITKVETDGEGIEQTVPDSEFLLGDKNEVILGDTVSGVTSDNGFVMAFRWEDKTNTPFFKNSQRFIFNDAKYTIRKYIKTVSVSNGVPTNIDLIFGKNLDITISGTTNINAPSNFNSYLLANNGLTATTTSVKSTLKVSGTTYTRKIVSSNSNGAARTTIDGNEIITDSIISNEIDANKIYGEEIETESLIVASGTTEINSSGITSHYISASTINVDIAYETSDIREKNIIERNPEFDIEKILGLTTIYFSYKNDSNNKKRLGVIAQEIQEICPEIVWEDEDKILHVEYNKLVLLLLTCVKDLYNKIKN